MTWETNLKITGKRRIVFILVLTIALLPGGAAAQQTAKPLIQSVGPIEMTVSDIDRAAEFYSKVLSFERVSEQTVRDPNYQRLEGVSTYGARVIRMRLGDEYIELTQFLGAEGRPIPAGSRSNDRWFQHIAIVVSDIRRAYQRLHEAHVEQISSGPQRLPDWNVNAAGIEAFYFRDPDRHALEIIHYPADKGQAKWRTPTDRLFLGIDHTAIAVSDTNASLRFYRDLLGLRVIGGSDNCGIEQERLSGVPGALVHITSLRAASGPGIEFLEYRFPTNGRPILPDERATDLAHRETTLLTASIKVASDELRKFHVPFVSAGTAVVKKAQLGFHEGLLIRDPDGHAVRIIQP